MTAPTPAERTGRIARLLEALDTQGYRIGFEVLRAARLVPGWALKRGTPGLFEIDCPGRPGLHLNRDDTLALLRSRWLPAARAEIGATEPDVTDGITEAAKMEEPAPPSSPSPRRIDITGAPFGGVWIFIDDNTTLHLPHHMLTPLRDAVDAFLQGQP